jgi:serine/threonine protein kinase
MANNVDERAATAYDPNSREGEVLSDKFRLMRKLGEGGMGAVYEAEHTFLGRRVAIKFLHRELTRNEDARARFDREAKAAGALHGENVVATTDFGIASDGTPYIVMEYLEGEDLRTLIKRDGQLPVVRAVNIAIQVCRGLYAAHERRIIHRDLKPENLFITRRGDRSDLVKILDFGIAKLRGDTNNPVFTRTGTVMGTWHYMSIEQFRGIQEIDNRADIYSLAAIIYECLTGIVPHPGNSYEQIFSHVLCEKVAPPRSLRMGLPEGLELVVLKSLALEPSERHQSIAEFMQALTPFAGRQITPLESKIITPSETKIAETVVSRSEVKPKSIQTGADGSQASKPTSEQPSISKFRSERFGKKATLVFIGLLAMLAVGIAGWFVVSSRSGDSPASANGAHIVKPAPETTTVQGEAARGEKSPTTVKQRIEEIGEPPARSGAQESKTGWSKPPQTGAKLTSLGNKKNRPAGRPDGQKIGQIQPTPEASSRTTAPTPPAEPEPTVIERSRGKRKVKFDEKSPYE